MIPECNVYPPENPPFGRWNFLFEHGPLCFGDMWIFGGVKKSHPEIDRKFGSKNLTVHQPTRDGNMFFVARGYHDKLFLWDVRLQQPSLLKKTCREVTCKWCCGAPTILWVHMMNKVWDSYLRVEHELIKYSACEHLPKARPPSQTPQWCLGFLPTGFAPSLDSLELSEWWKVIENCA